MTSPYARSDNPSFRKEFPPCPVCGEWMTRSSKMCHSCYVDRVQGKKTGPSQTWTKPGFVNKKTNIFERITVGDGKPAPSPENRTATTTPRTPDRAGEKPVGQSNKLCDCGHSPWNHSSSAGCLAYVKNYDGKICPCQNLTIHTDNNIQHRKNQKEARARNGIKYRK